MLDVVAFAAASARKLLVVAFQVSQCIVLMLACSNSLFFLVGCRVEQDVPGLCHFVHSGHLSSLFVFRLLLLILTMKLEASLQIV